MNDALNQNKPAGMSCGTGPYLPWRVMGFRPGNLQFQCSRAVLGERTRDLEDLAACLEEFAARFEELCGLVFKA